MYEGPDQSWRSLPKLMPPHVIRAVADGIVESASMDALDEVRVVLHGGEPLSTQLESLAALVNELRQVASASNITLRFAVQTNATAFTPANLAWLRQQEVAVGVSLDGPASIHDRVRLDPKGGSTHSRVIKGIEQMRDAGLDLSGVLAVADFSSDPAALLDYLFAFRPQTIDLLLPDQNWDRPPEKDASAIATWLTEAFDHWTRSPEAPQVRTFAVLMALALGWSWGTDTWGVKCPGFAVVDTDGGLLACDELRLTSTATSRPVTNITEIGAVVKLRESAEYSLVTERLRNAWRGCGGCSERALCGGGHPTHRFSSRALFDNPSIYCEAFKMFLPHVRAETYRGLQLLGVAAE